MRHTLTIVIRQWYLISKGSTNCVFSCFLVDGLRVLAKHQSYSTVFLWMQSDLSYIELNCSYLRHTQLFWFMSHSTILYTSNSNCSLYVELNCSYLRCTQTVLISLNSKVFYSTLQRVYSTPSAGPSVLDAYFMKSPISGTFINAYSMKSSIILYSALCSRMSLYPVSRVYTTVNSGLCNSEIPLRILILWLWDA